MSEKSKKSIQEKMQTLNELIAWFQSPDFTLEQAVGKYEAAEKLAEEIESDLMGLKNKIEVVKQKFQP